jgi:hypothetical protein
MKLNKIKIALSTVLGVVTITSMVVVVMMEEEKLLEKFTFLDF